MKNQIKVIRKHALAFIGPAVYYVLLVTLTCINGCSVKESKGEGVLHAIRIVSPGDVDCYAIVAEDGHVVGGNCK